MDTKKVGEINERIIKLLGLNLCACTPIIIGRQNILHMIKQHPTDYLKYGGMIEDIIKTPTYVSRNPRQQSIEYIKVYTKNKDHVLLAIRISGRGVYFARTLFIMSVEKIKKYIEKDALIPYM